MTTLVLVTGSYPYSAAAENTFLPQELEVLSEHFEKIIVVPLSIDGARDDIALSNLQVETGFAGYARSRWRKWLRLVGGAIDPELLRECIVNRSIIARHPETLRRTIGYYVQSRMMERWMRGYVRRLGAAPAILCTWWFDSPTLGLARFARRNDVRVITRAHGYDLYETRHSPAYIPFRRAAMELIDRVFPDSAAGVRHLIAEFPFASSKVELGLLGINDPGFLNAPSSDGVLRVVSCSFLSPVKRIDLLIRGLARYGADFPTRRVSWVHLGDGPEKEKLQAAAQTAMPSNVEWRMPGYPGREGLYDFYRSQPVDLFVNVSESEGTPISIIEALSLGIPVLCTAVGGNTETVANGNGLVLESNPTPVQIAEGINAIALDPGRLQQMRAASREHWQNRYDAAKNYAAFAESIGA